MKMASSYFLKEDEAEYSVVPPKFMACRHALVAL